MKQKITVLIIEDNPDDLLLLQEALGTSAEIDAVVLHEERLQSALDAAGKNHVDVAVIDLSLPDSFGLDTFLSFQSRFPAIPAIIMTGGKDQEMAFTAVQNGAQDYLFKGEQSSTAIVRTIRHAIERQRLTHELKSALERVAQLEGMLPICAACKRIRDDAGEWNHIEHYISRRTNVAFSHGICPDCAKRLYPDFDLTRD